MWEDPANKLGGKWIVSCPSADLSAMWEATVWIGSIMFISRASARIN